MYTQTLDGEWQLSKSGVEEWSPATVPGSVHTDLQAARVIPDPFYGDNELKVAWVAQTDWTYRRTFTPDEMLLAQDKVFLECDGLDTLATLRLNGEEIARTDNMHRRYTFDVTGKLNPGENTIEVEFASPVNYVNQRLDSDPLVITPGHSLPGSPYLRKAPYQWGWDWGPKLPTSGIWRHIRLAGYSYAKLEDIRVKQVHGRTRVEVHVEAQVERFTDAGLMVRARLTSPDGTVLEEQDNLGTDGTCGAVDFLVEDPKLWWPNGYGDQPLYILEVELIPSSPDEFPEGHVIAERTRSHQSHSSHLSHPTINHQPSTINHCIDSRTMRFGLRTVELRQDKDEWGRSWYFVVNGVPIFAKGANWIPADQFPSRITDDQYRDLIWSAASANMNMLRVWGGGIYEDDRFYDLCDEYGILVWQEFAFSCGHYPVYPEYLENVWQEAIDNIRRIRHHASLVLWCGNNEMEWGVVNWWAGTENNDERQKQYKKIFYELLPKVHQAEDPDTPYWPSSPASDEPLKDPNGENEGDGHYWEVWHGRQPFTAYRQHFYRFQSEFGFESLPSMDTVKTFAEPADWNMTSYIMEQHQKLDAGNGLILYYLSQTFRFPKDFPMLTYVSQILQAEAMRCGVEHWRRNRNGYRCMGTLYWQFNDCWPVASWSSLEYSSHWKALHYAAKRFFAPVLVSAEETDCSVKLHVTNEHMEPFEGDVRWSLERLDGTVLKSGQHSVNVPGGSDLLISEVDLSEHLDQQTRREAVLVYSLLQDDERLSMGTVWFAPSKHLELPEVKIKVQVDELGRIALTSDVTARFVMLEVPGMDVRFSDNFFDLPAGRTIVISVESPNIGIQEVVEKLRVVSLRDSY